MFLQTVPFLQSQLEQVLAHHGKLDDFELRPYIHICLRTEDLGAINLIKCGSYLRIIHNRDPYAICDENPNLVLEIIQTGDWIAREMTSSYFYGEDPTKNNFEVWDTLIRFDRLSDATASEVSSKSLASHRDLALLAS